MSDEPTYNNTRQTVWPARITHSLLLSSNALEGFSWINHSHWAKQHGALCENGKYFSQVVCQMNQKITIFQSTTPRDANMDWYDLKGCKKPPWGNMILSIWLHAMPRSVVSPDKVGDWACEVKQVPMRKGVVAFMVLHIFLTMLSFNGRCNISTSLVWNTRWGNSSA